MQHRTIVRNKRGISNAAICQVILSDVILVKGVPVGFGFLVGGLRLTVTPLELSSMSVRDVILGGLPLQI